MVRIAKFNIEIDVNASAVNRGLASIAKTSRATAGVITTTLGGAFTAIGTAATAGLVAVGVALAAIGAGVVGIGVAVARQLPKIDKLAKSAQRLGLEFGELQEIQLGAAFSGLQAETVTGGLDKFARRLGEAAVTGASASSKSLKALGLNAEQLVKIPLPAALAQIGEELNKLETAAERAGVAGSIFGRNIGSGFVEFVRSGNLQAAAEFFERIGGGITSAEAARVEFFNDQLRRISTIVEVLTQRLTVALAPVLSKIADLFEQSAISVSNFFTTERIEGWVVSAVKGFEQVVKAFGQLLVAGDAFFVRTEEGFASITKAARGFANLVPEVGGLLRAVDSFRENIPQRRSESAVARFGQSLINANFADDIAKAFENADVAADKFGASTDKFAKAVDKQRNTALVRGSTAAASAITEALFGRRLIDEQQKANRELAAIERNTAEPTTLNVTAEVIV